MAPTLLNPQTTITVTQARQQVAERRQNHRVRQRARLAAFQEFRTSYCDLFDAADWQHYQAANGLQLATPTLLTYLRRLNPAFAIVAAPHWQAANPAA